MWSWLVGWRRDRKVLLRIVSLPFSFFFFLFFFFVYKKVSYHDDSISLLVVVGDLTNS